MKKSFFLLALLLQVGMVWAQSDPVIMTINGKPISRSEFEYSYNKNNGEGVLDKKDVKQYIDLFVNYKLKVEAAIEAGIDTTQSFKKEFLGYRNQQIRPSFINDSDIEREAQNIYNDYKLRTDSSGGRILASHIFLRLEQKADKEKQETVKNRIDSIYKALTKGAKFEVLAQKLSDDKASAVNGGKLPWISKGQTMKEFEEALYSTPVGKYTKPIKSPVGYHIIWVHEKGSVEPFDSIKGNIMRFIEQRGLREKIINDKLKELAKNNPEGKTADQLLDERAKEMEAKDENLKNLIREYHDGLLLYEISDQLVWSKATKDEEGLKAYFKKHKKNYRWDAPRYKGMIYHTKDEADIKAVKKAVKKVDFAQWGETLRKTFNNDSVLRIRVEKGLFKKGENAWIDKMVFKNDSAQTTPLKDFPYNAVYGKLMKAPKEMDDVRALVVADYQENLEKEWVEALRRQYPVVIDEEVVKTVNKH